MPTWRCVPCDRVLEQIQLERIVSGAGVRGACPSCRGYVRVRTIAETIASAPMDFFVEAALFEIDGGRTISPPAPSPVVVALLADQRVPKSADLVPLNRRIPDNGQNSRPQEAAE